MSSAILTIDDRGVANLTLNRPNVHNAFDEELISLLLQLLDDAAADPRVKVLVLSGQGRSFSAGADLDWMRRMALATREDNQHDAIRLELLMSRLNTFPRQTVAKVHGAAMAGGVGLVAACDIVISASDAVFAFSEVRLGLAPAVIAPYVIAKIGESQLRYYFLTGAKFTAQRALAMGLVHDIVEAADLDGSVEKMVNTLLQNGPIAMERTKQLIQAIAPVLHSEATKSYTTSLIAELRASHEGREGINAFLNKTEPGWRKVAIDQAVQSK